MKYDDDDGEDGDDDGETTISCLVCFLFRFLIFLSFLFAFQVLKFTSNSKVGKTGFKATIVGEYLNQLSIVLESGMIILMI